MTSTLYNGPHPIAGTLFEQIETRVKEFESISGRLAAADGDVETAYSAYMDSSEDAQAVKLRAVIEKAQTQLRELAEKNVKVETLSDEEKAKLTAESALIRTNIADSLKAIEAVNKSIPADVEGVEKAIREFRANDPTRSKKGRPVGTANTGSNSPRTYVHISVVGGNIPEGEPRKFERFSELAAFFKCEVLDLQAAFAQAAGVEMSAVAGVDVNTEFSFKPHENGATYTVSTTPKERKKPGKKPADSAAPESAPKSDETPAGE